MPNNNLDQNDPRLLLAAHGIAPNKALGQNFLIDENAINTILNAADIDGKAVLEIGPGLGALSGGIVKRAKKAAAVELDGRLYDILRQRFGDSLLLYHEDFLKTDLPSVFSALGDGKVCVVGNLPYYVTTPICMRLLESPLPIESMTLMLQQEAAERFFARPGSRLYAPMAILTQLYYHAENILSLSPVSYYPQPEISSCVIRLERGQLTFCASLPPLLRACFHMRRKTLLNNLKTVCADVDMIRSALEKCGLKPELRAEAIEPEAFLSLAEALS